MISEFIELIDGSFFENLVIGRKIFFQQSVMIVGEVVGQLQNFGTNLGRFKGMLGLSQKGNDGQQKERQVFQLRVLGYKFRLLRYI